MTRAVRSVPRAENRQRRREKAPTVLTDVRPQFRGLGLAKLMLNHLVGYAQSQGIGLLRLETGVHQHAAIGLYERIGFQRIPPFGEYKDDPLSRFYEKRIR